MKKDKYYKYGYNQAILGEFTYNEASDAFDLAFPELKNGSSEACSWENGWNQGNQDRYDDELETDMKIIIKKYKFSSNDLDVLKRFFTDDLQDQINEIKRCM